MSSQATTTVIIRNFLTEDLPQILAIENQVALEPWDQAIFISCAREYYFIVAVIDNMVVGYSIIAIYNNIFEAHILNLAVDVAWHRRGIGSKLINYLIDLCAKNFNYHPHKLFLEVNTHNQPAILLYKKFNFIELYIRKNYYNTKSCRQDAVVMVNNQE